jgi:transcriptional regulator with XRE-family HTH domain
MGGDIVDLVRLGTILRQRREALRIPRAELAATLGLSPGYLYLVEDAKPRSGGKPSQPKGDLLERWARALDLDPSATRQILILAGRVEGTVEEEALAGLDRVAPDPALPPPLQERLLIEELTEVLGDLQRHGGWGEAVPEIEELLDRLRRQSTPLLPTYRSAIWCPDASTLLAAALAEMRGRDYSQLVVRDGGRLALLTAEGITGWLASQSEGGAVDLAAACISDALPFEAEGNSVVLAGNRTVEEAHRLIRRAVDEGRPRLYAVIITEGGKVEEEPLGLLTPWDVIAWSSQAYRGSARR